MTPKPVPVPYYPKSMRDSLGFFLGVRIASFLPLDKWASKELRPSHSDDHHREGPASSKLLSFAVIRERSVDSISQRSFFYVIFESQRAITENDGGFLVFLLALGQSSDPVFRMATANPVT